MRPATRSTFDILYWFNLKAVEINRSLETPFIIKLLYLCQALHAASHQQQKLMPATFLSTEAGPIEPDAFLALEHGFELSSAVAPSADVEKTLSTVWQICQNKSLTEIDFILSFDTALKAASSRGRNAEITIGEMAAAYKNGGPLSRNEIAFNKFPDGSAVAAKSSNLEAAPNAQQEVRFTADGRSVTKWAPTKRVSAKS
ncbi:MAG: hypothetical protein V7723_10605 [Sneathiella sp.]|uniref:hypothetical protein n=1 Tax=Sneathiella sp. TaxID=1964365 RepID=UPI0030021759